MMLTVMVARLPRYSWEIAILIWKWFPTVSHGHTWLMFGTSVISAQKRQREKRSGDYGLCKQIKSWPHGSGVGLNVTPALAPARQLSQRPFLQMRLAVAQSGIAHR